MMHGRGESDTAIVVRSRRQGGAIRCGAGGAKGGDRGNAGQHSTCRAQDRASVSQALERIRQVARQRKKKFTALLHHLSIVTHRVGDPRIIRLIRKWLKAGILEDGVVTVADRGRGRAR